MNRFVEAILSFVLLVLLSPLFLLIAISILLADGAPVFYSQVRVGKDFVPFRMLKFRTMRGEGESITVARDARITGIGAYLRKWKLDELPQLWNVLAGHMSLVGPRPELPEYVDFYRERYARVLTVRPGITDPASIEYVDEESLLAQSKDPIREYRERILPAKLALAENYVSSRSLASDLKIFVRTAAAIFSPSRRNRD